jgi:hypothetical protein
MSDDKKMPVPMDMTSMNYGGGFLKTPDPFTVCSPKWCVMLLR